MPKRIVTDPIDGSEHDLGHEEEFHVGDRFVDSYGGPGVIIGLGHIQPAVQNAGYDGKQSFRASRWYEVQLDKGGRQILNPERIRRT